jgi:DNA-binding MarR family transcriptional regulator
MSEYVVERAREIFQARRTGQGRRERPPRVAGTREQAEQDGDAGPGDFIGALHLIHSRLRRLDGWLREKHQLNLTEMYVISVIPTVPPAQRTAGRGDAAARLAREAELSPSGLTRLVNRLVTRGLVARVDDAWDGRITHLVLTEEGRFVRDAVLPQAVEHIRDCGTHKVALERLRDVAKVSRSRRTRRGSACEQQS